MNYVFVVSDGTGGTAERALNAAMTQFESTKVQVELRPGVRTEDEVTLVVEEAASVKGIIIHTLVSDEIRHFLIRMSRLHNVENIDIMGPLLSRLSQQFSLTPSQKPGLFRQLNEDYFRRIETMEFALKHDDGQRIHELNQAEIVLVGVSRTFKTPLSVYLAFKRWFAANVPIVLDIEPPSILSEIPPERVFGLTMDTRRLSTLRRIRDEYLDGKTGEYSDLHYVRREVLYALEIFENPPKWPVINVTGKPIEEIASEIIALARPGQKLGD
ncbi:MAG: kinase/pyrophosphorylase [Calditrichia bacterium]|jgi:[pyruvate, water dikinase]-phosphate phosphotransferase / [pyruvate, water dikinase] kinase